MKERLYLFYGVWLLGLVVILGRLFQLQIIFGARHRAIAEGNRIRKIIKWAPRGIIYDRKGRMLVQNEPVYKKCQGLKEACQLISREEALAQETKGEKVEVEVKRRYVYGPVLAHLLGYLGGATKEEVKRGVGEVGEWIGRTGVEEAYDQTLRGKNGGELIEVDARGNKVREIGRIEPLPGQSLYLSVDAELSRVAYQALAGYKGAVVATEAKTGQVLVLVSRPSFDPNLFTEVSRVSHLRGGVKRVLDDPRQPLFNRALAGLYPPGSTFKIITAVAGLEEGKIDQNTFYEDPGEIRVGKYVYRNWYFSQYHRTEGKINVVQAIKRSTDTFFYQLGEKLGATRLSWWAKRFGLGRKTGIDLPGEAAGLVPDPEWKKKTKGERWFLGNTYHFAIGQADLLTTPLQINQMTSVIANDGWLCRPRVVKSDDSECQDLKLKPETLRLVQEGMKEACAPGGTAFPFFHFQPVVACKTGTAEFNDPAGRTHAWLTAYAPAEEPEIVVTALVEAGGEGAYVAAPIVKKVLEAYFSQSHLQGGREKLRLNQKKL